MTVGSKGKAGLASDADFMLRKDLGARNYERRSHDRAKKYQRKLEKKGRNFHNLQMSNTDAKKESHPSKNFWVRPKSAVYHTEGLSVGAVLAELDWGGNDPLAQHQQEQQLKAMFDVSVAGKTALTEESKSVGVDKYCGKNGKGSRKRNHAFISLDQTAGMAVEKKRSGPLTKKLAVALAREGLAVDVVANARPKSSAQLDFDNQNNKMSLSEYQKAQADRRSNHCNFLEYAFLFEPSVRDSPKAIKDKPAPIDVVAEDATATVSTKLQMSNSIEKEAQMEASVYMDNSWDEPEIEFAEVEDGLIVIDDEREIEEGFTLI